MNKRKARIDKKPDGTDHVIDDNGRTCTIGGDYHTWDNYRLSPKGKHGRTARCNACANKIAGKVRVARKEKLANPVFDSPINILLMSKWNKQPSFCN